MCREELVQSSKWTYEGFLIIDHREYSTIWFMTSSQVLYSWLIGFTFERIWDSFLRWLWNIIRILLLAQVNFSCIPSNEWIANAISHMGPHATNIKFYGKEMVVLINFYECVWMWKIIFNYNFLKHHNFNFVSGTLDLRMEFYLKEGLLYSKIVVFINLFECVRM